MRRSTGRRRLSAGLSYGYLGLLMLFLYIPILVLVLYSFNAGGRLTHFSGFSLKWYSELFFAPKNRDLLRAVYITVACAAAATAVSVVFGTIAALGIFSVRRGMRSTLLNITYLPILNPDIVTAVSLMALFAFSRLPMGFGTMVLAHISFDVPYVIFAVLPRLAKIDPHTYEAAVDLGASPARAMWKVLVPQLIPGIVSGALLAFTLSMDDFVISYFTGGDAQNLSVKVYAMAKRGVSPEVNALSALMFAVVLTLLLVANRKNKTALLI